MRKKKAGRGVRKKQEGPAKTVDEYIAGAPEKSRGMLRKMRATIQSAVPRGATEVISYGIPAIQHNGTVVWYAAFAEHCSLFPKASVIEEFRDELKGFKASKGTIHFQVDKALPARLIRRIVKARVKQMKLKK